MPKGKEGKTTKRGEKIERKSAEKNSGKSEHGLEGWLGSDDIFSFILASFRSNLSFWILYDAVEEFLHGRLLEKTLPEPSKSGLKSPISQLLNFCNME